MHLSRASISVSVVLVGALSALYLNLFEDIMPGWWQLKPFSAVVGSLVTLGLLFEYQLWHRWPFKHAVKLPDLRGTWEAELQSTYCRPGESEPVPAIRCFFPVKQRYSKLELGLITPESSSSLISYSILPADVGDGHQIVGVYRDEPKVGVRDRSEIHRGALILKTHGPTDRPDSLTGEYWTDRSTNGSIKLLRRVDKLYSRFEDAETAFADASSRSRVPVGSKG